MATTSGWHPVACTRVSSPGVDYARANTVGMLTFVVTKPSTTGVLDVMPPGLITLPWTMTPVGLLIAVSLEKAILSSRFRI